LEFLSNRSAEANARAKEKIRGYIHGRIVGDDQSAPPTTRPVITCLGVWDTVGSYGIPAGLGLGALARKVTSWTRGFHDNTIGRHVEYGLHAMAIDERRRAFPPTAWIIEKDKSKERPNVEQVWFAGSHSNIGGGYRRSGLADLALIWMIARVSECTQLEFDDDYIAENFWPCAACSLYNSDRGWLLSSLRPYLRPALGEPPSDDFLNIDGKKERRKMERLNEKVHWSVVERLGRIAIVDELRNRQYSPPNLPTNLLKDLPDEGPPPDTRVAGKTRREKELIALCRRGADNERIQHCALFCDLTKLKPGPSPVSFPGQSYFRDKLSADGRRARRLGLLQEIWKMGQSKKT
jgi:hypothetical protein